MSAERGWIAEPPPPPKQWHRSYAAYRYEQIAERERRRIREVEAQAWASYLQQLKSTAEDW